MIDPIRKGYADTPSRQVHFRRVEGGGPPIILLHRTPASSGSFAAMLRLFVGRRTAIAFDRPGFGRSFRPSGSPGTIDFGRWLLNAVEAIGTRHYQLCAHPEPEGAASAGTA